MSNTPILDLPVAIGIDGSEYFPLVQAGTTKRAQTGLLFSSGGTPVTTEAANTFELGPVSGAPAAPTFRLALAADIGRGSGGTSGYLLGTDGTTQSWQGFLQAGTGAVTRTWQAKNRDIVSVKDFGAKGDNSTDDTAAIQAAIDAVIADNNGGAVYFPAGYYRISSTLTITCSGSVELVGDSWNASGIQTVAAGNFNMLFFSGGRPSIRNLALNGPGAQGTLVPTVAVTAISSTSAVVKLNSNCVDVVIDHCYITGGYNCVYSLASDVIIQNSFLTLAAGDGLLKASGNGTWLQRCKLDQNYPYAYNSSIASPSAWASGHVYAAGDIVTRSGFYIQCMVGGTSGVSAPTLGIYGVNIADGATVRWQIVSAVTISCAMRIDATQEVYTNQCDFTGCWESAIIGRNTSRYVKVINAVISQAIGHMIDFDSGGSLYFDSVNTGVGAINGANCFNFSGSFEGSFLINNSTVGSGSGGRGIHAGVGGSYTITGCQFGGCDKAIFIGPGVSNINIAGNNLGSPADLTPNTTGVYINTGASDYYQIMGNVFQGASTAIVDLGTGIHKTLQTDATIGFGALPGAGVTLQLGTLTNAGSTSPYLLSLGASYNSGTAYTHPKLNIYQDGTSFIGMGISSQLFEFMASDSGTNMGWYLNSAERMRLTTTGILAVGTATPGAITQLSQTPRLQIAGASGDIYGSISAASGVGGLGILGSAEADLMLVHTSAGASQKVWNLNSISGVLNVRLLNDTSSGVVATPAVFSSSGMTIATTLGVGAAVSGNQTALFSYNANLNAGNGAGVQITNANAGGNAAASINVGNDGGFTGFFQTNSSGNSSFAGVGSFNLGMLHNAPVGFVTNSTLKMTLSAAGGLGIGTATDPGAGGLRTAAQIWSGSVSSALTTLTGATDGFRGSAANVTQVAAENTTASSATQGGFVGMYSNDGAAMASGDRLGGMRAGGSSSASALRNSALIGAFADQAWVDASAYGSRWEFQTTTNGATSASTKLILDNAGVLSFGATATNTVPALKPSSTTLQVRLGDDSTFAPLSAASLTLASPLTVANGGTNASSASITAFNNITGCSATGTTGTTSTKLVFSTSPTLVTPVLGAATGTTLALGNLALGSGFILQVHAATDENWSVHGHSAIASGVAFDTFNDAVNANVPMELRANELYLATVAGYKVGVGLTSTPNSLFTVNGTCEVNTLRIDQTPTAVSGAGPIPIGSGSTINGRLSINMNGTTYWIPCTTTAF